MDVSDYSDDEDPPVTHNFWLFHSGITRKMFSDISLETEMRHQIYKGESVLFCSLKKGYFLKDKLNGNWIGKFEKISSKNQKVSLANSIEIFRKNLQDSWNFFSETLKDKQQINYFSRFVVFVRSRLGSRLVSNKKRIFARSHFRF